MLTTARLDCESGGLRSRAGGITEQESETCARGDGNSPGLRGARQIIPGNDSRAGWVVTRVDALQTTDVSDGFFG